MKRLTPRQVARAVPFEAAERSSIVAKRAANNNRKGKSARGLAAKVSDSDPMANDSESNWP